MASLSFDFPDHLVIQFPSPEANAPQQATETPRIAHGWQLNDLQELSGEEEDDSNTDLPQQQAQSYPAGLCSHGASVMPDEVLLLVVDLLGLREVMGLACCCKAWHMCLLHSSAADGIWEQQERQLLGECVSASGGGLNQFCQRHHNHMLVMLRSARLAVGAFQGCHACGPAALPWLHAPAAL